MKYVYILVGSMDGFYYEHTLVSIASLKYVSPSAKVTLLIDDVTDYLQHPLLAQICSYVDEKIVQKFEKSVPNIARSRLLKTTMRFIVDGDFLYVDSDTVWAKPVDVSDFTEDVMGVLDGHCLLKDHPLHTGILQEFVITGCNPVVEKYMNGGVLFVKDSGKAREFFEIWHERWLETSKSGLFIDMPSLNYAFKQMYGDSVPLLNGTYNAQISRSWKYFPNAKIIHLFTGWMNEEIEKPYRFQTKKFWNFVKKNGLDEYVVQTLQNPFEAFNVPIKICDKEELGLQKTATYGLIMDLYRRKLKGEKSKFNLVEMVLKKILSLF